jgi:hypothetical protein
MKIYGVLTDDGIGDLIQGTEWRYKDSSDHSEGVELKTLSGEWVDVYSVFEVDNINFLY